MVDQDGEDKQLIYWHVNFPWPMAHRDYVYRRQFKILTAPISKQTVYAVMARYQESLKVPEKPDIVRVTRYDQACFLTVDGQGGSRGKSFVIT